MANNNNNTQPQFQPENIVEVHWTDVQFECLIGERLARNTEFWSLGKGGKAQFWKKIRDIINEIFGTNFTADQVSKKWRNLKDEHMVSIYTVFCT